MVISSHEVTPSSLFFSWNEIPCGSRNSSGFQYEFRLQLTDSVIEGWHSTSNTSVSFSDLNACALYHFEVRAVNNNGSDKSSTMSVSTGVISKLT